MISASKEYFDPLHSPNSSEICKVVLVADDVAADMRYLAELGFNVTQMISDHIDTSDLHKAAHRDARQPALSTLLLQYGIAGRYLISGTKEPQKNGRSRSIIGWKPHLKRQGQRCALSLRVILREKQAIPSKVSYLLLNTGIR